MGAQGAYFVRLAPQVRAYPGSFPEVNLRNVAMGPQGLFLSFGAVKTYVRFLVCFRSAARIKELEIIALSSFSTCASEMSVKKTNIRKCHKIAYIASSVIQQPWKFLEVYQKFSGS